MKVVYEEEKALVMFRDISPGSCFVDGVRVFMKIGEYSAFNFNAVSLASGLLEHFHDTKFVKSVECDLLVKGVVK